MKLDQQQLQHIQQYLRDQPVLKAYLFGSFVRGEAGITSDIDLLLELDYSHTIGLKFVQMQLDLENLLHKKVDLVSAAGLSPHIKPHIDKEKQLIYARG